MGRLTDPEVSLKELPHCKHSISNPVTVIVLKKEVILKESSLCKACLELYLNRFSILCVVCQNPILPLEHVTDSITFNSNNGFAHTRCAPVGCLGGIWGEGYLVPIQELED